MTEEPDDVGRNFRQILNTATGDGIWADFFVLLLIFYILRFVTSNTCCCIYITPSETRKIIFLHFLDKKTQNYASMQLKLNLAVLN